MQYNNNLLAITAEMSSMPSVRGSEMPSMPSEGCSVRWTAYKGNAKRIFMEKFLPSAFPSNHQRHKMGRSLRGVPDRP